MLKDENMLYFTVIVFFSFSHFQFQCLCIAMVFMKPRFILKKKKSPPEVQRPSVASSPLLIQTRLLRNWPIWKLKHTLEYLQRNSDPRQSIWKYVGQFFLCWILSVALFQAFFQCLFF